MPEFDMNYAFLIVGILLTFAILASKIIVLLWYPVTVTVLVNWYVNR